MSEKKNFVLRLDESIYKHIEKWAADEFRSVNGQLEWIIHQQLRAAGRLPKTEPAKRKATNGETNSKNGSG